MLDLHGPELTVEEQEMLHHPLVGGVILFSRNYISPDQITALVERIHTLREPHLLVAVDHEGGRIQRFRDGFTPLLPAAVIGKTYDADNHRGLELAKHSGWIMAAELRAVGVDFSFAPVLDLGVGVSEVIGDRAFHHDPLSIAKLAKAYLGGMRDAGMVSVGKHFPGHGSVSADSHLEVPIDQRPFEAIEEKDLVPFKRLAKNELQAIMLAHVIYPKVDTRPAGFSVYWLQEVLRRQLAFQGVVISDDLCMAGASVAGSPQDRAQLALEAGCDMLLVCNDTPAAISVLDGLRQKERLASTDRLAALQGSPAPTWSQLKECERWQRVSVQLRRAVDGAR